MIRPRIRDKIYYDIDLERVRQKAIHGDNTPDNMERDPYRFLCVLVEEVGEVARGIWENDSDEDLHNEIIQVAAVAVAYLEGVDAANEMEIK